MELSAPLTLTPASVGDAAEIVLLANALAAIWISVGLVVVAAI
jgi:hypothetical protein